MSHDSDAAPMAPNGDREPPYFDVQPAKDSASPLLFLCDHASNWIPPRLNDLGLGPDQLQRHIAYDPGAAGVTRALSAHFGATAVLGRFSRLVIDPNRAEDDPTLIMRIADRAVVAGNRQLDDAERSYRLETFYRPYHAAISAAIDGMIARGVQPVIISIHSFTEAWRGMPRPWQFSILWDQDARIAGPLLNALRQQSDLVVGDNEPYTGRLKGDTMWRHGTQRDLPHALVEVRQDLIKDAAGQKVWADRLAVAIETALENFAPDRAVATNVEQVRQPIQLAGG